MLKFENRNSLNLIPLEQKNLTENNFVWKALKTKIFQS